MSLALFDISGKVAMATGGTRGLGEVAAKALAGAGADVAVCGRNRRDLDRVSNDIIDLGRDAAEFPLDVTSKEMVAFELGVNNVPLESLRPGFRINNCHF